PPTGDFPATPTPIADATLSLPARARSGRASRRSMLTRAAAAFGALGLAGAAGNVPSVHARPPESIGTGLPLQIGVSNEASSVNDVTLLQNPTAGLLIIQPSVRILHVDNRFGSQTTFPSNLRISIAGTANFQAAGSERF